MAKIPQRMFEAIPTGEYPATIGAAVIQPSRFEPDKQQVKIRFDLLARGLEDRSVFAYPNAVDSPNSTMRKIAVAAFGGRVPPKEYVIDTEDLLDRKLIISVVRKTLEDGREVNKVVDFRPVANALPGPAAARPSTPPPDRNGGQGGVIPRTGQGASSGPSQVNTARPDEPPDWMSEPPSDNDSLPF